jgi:hypothetical protein
MRFLPIHIAIGLILLSTIAFPQEKSDFSTDQILECIAESYTGELEDEADLTNILDDLQGFIESPLNINLATREDLEKLIVLNDRQIETLLAYRDKMGQIYSQQELLTLDGFNEKVVDDLSVFINFQPPDEKPRKYIKNEVTIHTQYTFEKASGFIADKNGEKKFSGIEPKLLLKYRADKDGRFDLGLNAENDAGEPFFTGSNRAGFDFYSGFLGWKGKNLVRKVYLGDFQIKTGQGSIFGSGYGGRKSAEATNIRSTGQGIKPSASTIEYGFFRGIAAQCNLAAFNLIAFYSNKNSDANITLIDGNKKPVAVSSLQTTGYHRTESEISDKNSLNVQTAGVGAKFTRNSFSAGFTTGYQKYNIPVEPTEKLYNQYYFRGKENYNIGADYLWMLNQINFFGEAAFSKSGGTALITGIETNPSNEITFSLLLRDYKKDFHPINGSSFSEFGSVSNETGIYSGLTCYAIPKMTISSYLDLYESYWIKYNSTKPVKGYDFLFQSEYSLTRDIDLTLRFKTETRNENSSLPSTIKQDVTLKTNHIRFNVEWKPSENLNFRFRSEWSGIEKEDSLKQGWLMLTDASIHTTDEKLSFTVRLAWFKTDNYDSRIYAYENDVPSSFNIPAYYSNGWRYYLNMKYKVLKNISIYLKLSQTRYLNTTSSIGSGYSQITGDHKTEFKFQLRFLF